VSRESWRIIGAIAAKDIADAVRNKTIIGVIIGVAVLMLSSQALPLITRLSTTHRIAAYDPGASRVIQALKRGSDISLVRVSSKEELEEFLGESTGVVLGVDVPAGFDQVLDAGQPAELEGYFVHWVGTADRTQAVSFFEAQLTRLAGQPVRINASDHTVYPGPDSDGQPFLASISLVVTILTMGVVLVPFLIIEEKETKTMDALLISPASIGQVVVGKAIAGMIYGIAAAAVVFAFNRMVVVHWGWSILATLAGTLFAVAVGLLMGSIFENPQNLNIWLSFAFALLLVPVLLDVTALPLPGLLDAVMPWIPSAALAKAFRLSFAGNIPLARFLEPSGYVTAWAVLLLGGVTWIVRQSDR
jgi:ABC-2 type transport system permease protein